MDDKKTRYSYIISQIIIFLIGCFVRVYKLGQIPFGVYIDEPPLAYSAWCIANYGVDRYLKSYPVYFRNWYSGQSPLYIYLLSAIYKLGGKVGNVFVMRLPACILSILIMVVVYLTVKELTQKKYLHIFALLVTAFSPFFVLQGRVALDCNLLLFCISISIFFLIRYLNKGKLYLLLCSYALFALALYSYALSYILLACFIPTISFYLLFTKKVELKKLLLAFLCFCIVALPIFLFVISIVFHVGEYSILGITIAPVSAERAGELSFNGIIKKLVLSFAYSVWNDGKNVFTLSRFGSMYIVSIPLIVVGLGLSIYRSVKGILDKKFTFDFIFVVLFFANIFVGAINEYVFSYRVNSIYISYLYFIVLCVGTVCAWIKNKKFKLGFSISVCAIYILSSILFIYYYFNDYVKENDMMVHTASEELEYVQSLSKDADIYVEYSSIPELFLFEYPISPYEWNEKTDIGKIHVYIPDEINSDCIYIIRNTSNNIDRINAYGDMYTRVENKYFSVYIPKK